MILRLSRFEGAEAQGLALGEIPRVLQPDEPCLVQQCFVGRPLLADPSRRTWSTAAMRWRTMWNLSNTSTAWGARALMTSM